MATGFSTRSGLDGYRLNFDTDNLDYYLLMQKIARHCVGGKPAADVAEVRHGRWGEYESFPLTPSLNGHPCSECGMRFSTSAIPVMKYCPNCGARMEKEEEP